MTSLIADLRRDNCLHQSTDLVALDAHFESGSRVVYCGFDPTGPSLHAGHLLSLTVMRRFLERGHTVVALVGSATARIGDPSFRDAARRPLDSETVGRNAAAIAEMIERVLGRFGDLRIVDNIEWLGGMGHLDFMEMIGRHFTLSRMLGFEGVRGRLDSGGSMTFPEFGYMLLQAADFLMLHRRFGCTVQAGGSDQWGNMVNGVDLIRKADGGTAMALTTPLLTMANGNKMGKTAHGAVWLDPERTHPHDFWQFWRDMPDEDAMRMAPMLVGRDATAAALSLGPNALKGAIADQMSLFVHGVERPEPHAVEIPEDVSDLPAALQACGLAESRAKGRRLVEQGAVRIDGTRVRVLSALPSPGSVLSVGRNRAVRISGLSKDAAPPAEFRPASDTLSTAKR